MSSPVEPPAEIGEVEIEMKFDVKKDLKRLIVVLIASMLMAVNIKTFVRTGGLYPGGVTGLTVLIQRVCQLYFHFEIPYSVVNIALNFIPVYIGFKFIGKKFTIYSLIMILCTGFLTDMLPGHVITYDTLLIAIFGGIINGIVVSLCLSVDATSGGTDFIAIYLSQKRGMETWNLVLGFNVIILGAAGILFGWDKALYSIVFQYVSTQTLQTFYRAYQRQTLFIITDKPEEISEMIFKISHHGATLMTAQGAHEHKQLHIVYSVIGADDAKKVILKTKEIDENAFVNSFRTTELAGNFYMRPKD